MNKQPLSLNDSNFETITAATDQPVLVDFYADWCGPCKAIAPVIEELAGEFDGKAVIAKVNVDDAPQVAARFGIRSIPTIAILENGAVVEQMVGLMTKRALASKLESRLTPVKG
ncbi:MAG: thioredoxin [Planctomycetota bacterium]|jgi:thioredoxin 1